MNFKITKTKVFTGMMSGAAAMMIGVAGIGAVPAFAQTATPPATTPSPSAKDKSAKIDGKLEKIYAREQQALAKQQQHLGKANELIAKANDKITKFQGEGKDVSALQTALNTFKSQVADAQTQHDTAAKILSAHAGFGTDGKVTDDAAARQTVKDAAQSLRDAHRVLRQARHDAIKSARQWAVANGIKTKSPTVQSTPTN